MDKSKTVYERYKKEIYRIGWNVQYRAKKINRRELPLYDNVQTQMNFTQLVEDRMISDNLMRSLSSDDRLVLHQAYIQGYNETEIAKHFNMSQQAVNKWKKRILNRLSPIRKYYN